MGHYFYNAYLEKAAREGLDPYYAAQSEEAREAQQLDERATWAHELGKTTSDFLKAAGKDHFDSKEEQAVAFADPLYKASQAYRDAVETMLLNSEWQHAGMKVMAPGECASDTLTSETMIATANEEARRSESRKVFGKAYSDPKHRADVLNMLADPESQALADQVENDFSNEQPLQRAIRLAGHGVIGPDLGHAMAQEEADNGSSGAKAPTT